MPVSRACAELIRQHRHVAENVRDIGMGAAPDHVIAEYARHGGFALVSADFDFAEIRLYPPAEYAGIVVIDGPSRAIAADILQMLERLLHETSVIIALPGRPAIVDPGRIRLRPPLPG